jgi:hypothetical protein
VTPGPLSHERALELLPWLVNGTLQAAERDALEQHVRACIVCRRELREQQRLATAVRAQPVVHVSAQAGLDELDRMLGASAREVRAAPSLRRRYLALRPFAVAAAAGIALLAFLLWLTPLPQPGPEAYSTLATPPGEGAVLVDVVFAQQTTAAEIGALLAKVGGEIVAGPSAVGRYSVRLGDGPLDQAAVERALATLSSDPRVRFAGRSFTEPAR